MAASRTVRAMGPAVSWLWAMGTMPARLIRPSVGLMPTIPFDDDGTHHRAVGFRAHRQRAEVGGDSRARAGTRSARIAIERVGISGEAAAAAPAAGGVTGTDVGPLAEIGLAENDRAGVAKFLGYGGILRRSGSRPAPAIPRWSCMRSAVSMLSLIRTGIPCRGPRGPLLFALLIESVSDGERIGIEFDDAIDGRAMLIEGIDSRQIFLGERAGGEPAGRQSGLQIGNSQFVQFKGAESLAVAQVQLRGLPRRLARALRQRLSQQAGLQKSAARWPEIRSSKSTLFAQASALAARTGNYRGSESLLSSPRLPFEESLVQSVRSLCLLSRCHD